jgi:membrane associated rhomboid family serine protease
MAGTNNFLSLQIINQIIYSVEIWDEIKMSFQKGSVITRLIYVNLAIFILFRIIHLIFFLSGNQFYGLQYFELPSGFNQFLQQPWSLITYMFVHFNFLHILFNLLVLYWFGRIFLDYYSQPQLLGLYLLGGIAGGIVYTVAYNLFPVFSQVVSDSFLLGASASIIAILIAAAFRDPNRDIFLFLIGRIPLKFLALFMVISYIIGISTSNAGGNLAHLGGVLMGWIFFIRQKKGYDITSFITLFFNRLQQVFKPRVKVKIVHRQPPRDDYEYNRQRAADHNELNRILDKIGKEGYDSLTKEEKETLFRHGK